MVVYLGPAVTWQWPADSGTFYKPGDDVDVDEPTQAELTQYGFRFQTPAATGEAREPEAPTAEQIQMGVPASPEYVASVQQAAAEAAHPAEAPAAEAKA